MCVLRVMSLYCIDVLIIVYIASISITSTVCIQADYDVGLYDSVVYYYSTAQYSTVQYILLLISITIVIYLLRIVDLM
jgi:hypothetical protein